MPTSGRTCRDIKAPVATLKTRKKQKFCLKREKVTSLSISLLSDRRFSSEQETKLFYAVRAKRGHQFCGVSKNPRGRNLFLLGLFFG